MAWVLPAIAVLLALTHRATIGLIDTNGGRGYDGIGYARMLTDGLFAVSGNQAVRPLVVLLTRPAYWLTGDPVTAFMAMNIVWTAALTLGLVKLGEHYRLRPSSMSFGVVLLFLTVALGLMPAFYPVLVDLGALAIITWALYLALVGSRWRWAAAIAAVLAREFGLAVVLFNAIADLRRRRLSASAVAAACAMSGAVFWVLRASQSAEATTIRFAGLAANLHLWLDPAFVLFFLYFALTVFGGLSVIMAVTAPRWIRFVAREWEWIGYMAFLTAAATAGSWDIWRYLAFLAPAAFVLTLVGTETLPEETRWMLFGGAFVFTIVTQLPFQAMTLNRYFLEWFPYYALRGNTPNPLQVWPFWTRQIAFASVGLVTLIAVVKLSPGMKGRSGAATRVGSAPGARTGVRAVLLGSVVALILLAAVGVQEDAYAPRINVRWIDGLPEAEREAAERRFGLTVGIFREQNTWAYDLTRSDAENGSAILADARVADTHHLDRTTGLVSPDAPRGRTLVATNPVASLKRQIPFGSLLRLFGSLGLVATAWLLMTLRRDRTAPRLE